ncbi:hypothetical protein GCM10027422_49410 [Hymenobacter arcticus]
MRKELAAFATHRRQPLSFEGLTKAFYDGLRNYMLGVAGRSPRTFNTYVKRLRSFLFWAEGQDLPVPPRFRKTLRLAPSYVGIDALTQAELLRVAALDFASPAVLTYLSGIFPEPPAREGRGAYHRRPRAARRVDARRVSALRLHQPAPRRRPGAGLAARLPRAAPA